MTHPRHIIQKSTVDLQFNGGGDAFALQREVDAWCHQRLMPLLDEVLNSYDELNEHLRIDRLEVDVAIDLDDGWKEKLTETVSRQLRERLAELDKKESGIELSRKTIRQRFTDLLVFYLEKGYLPWWSRVKDKSELVEQWGLWLKENEAGENLRAALDKYSACLRAVQLLPEDLFYALVGWLNPELKRILPGLLNELKQITEESVPEENKKVEVAFQAGLLKLAAEGKDISRQLVLGDVIRNEGTVGNNDLLVSEAEAVFISNAGLVIVAAFLPTLFERLNIVEEGKITEPGTALGLLHYLVWGEVEPAEFELVLPKIICGMEVGKVVLEDMALTVRQKEEADDLLRSVVEHWSILKDTSIGGLREAFLQREGKLTFQNGEWFLQMERKPYDMLLQHIPWNVSFVKLAWMGNVLKTEWA